MQSRTRSRSRTAKRPRTRTVSARPRTSVSRRTVALAAPNVGLGNSVTTVLRTSVFSNITATAGTGIANFYLSPGSAFDPVGNVAAIQPQMFDQFAAMYSRYKVNSATVRVKITGKLAAAGAVWVAAAYPAVDSTPLLTYQAAASQQYAKTTSGGFQIQGAIGIGAEGKYLNFKKINHDSIVGAKSDTWDIGALVTANPTALQYMELPFFLQGDTAGAHQWVIEIDMWQNVTFSQKKNTIDA